MPPKTFNIKAIAAKTQVSTATISRALNAETRHKVAPETLRKIEAVLEKYPYTPDISARLMRKTVYKTLGILFPHEPGILASDYYAQILSGAADAVLGTDYTLKMILIKPGQQADWDHYHFQQGEGIDGLVLTYWRSLFSGPEVFERLGIPCVILNNVEKNIQARFTAGDHFAGGRLAAQYLYEKGHRRIAVFGGKQGAPDAAARLAGFKSYLKEKHVPLKPEAEFDVRFEEEKAYQMTDALLDARPAYTAVFCMNDCQAFGVLRRLKELKVPCPQKLSVMGYDNERASAQTVPPLTTIQVPVYELARAAVHDLAAQLKKKTPAFYKPAYFPVSLVERQSVATLK
jgi:LacI family transcriptional regulator